MLVRGPSRTECVSVQQIHRHLAEHTNHHDGTHAGMGLSDRQGEARSAPALSALLSDRRTAQVWNNRPVPKDSQAP